MRLLGWTAAFSILCACAGDSAPPDGLADAGAPSGADAGSAQLGLVSAAELRAALEHKDFLLVNVHVPLSDGWLPGTDASITWTDTETLVAFIGSDLGRRVVLTCKSAYMSGVAGEALVQRGYRAVRHLEGGMNAWVAAGYAIDH